MRKELKKEDYIVEREFLSEITAEEFVVRLIKLLIFRDSNTNEN